MSNLRLRKVLFISVAILINLGILVFSIGATGPCGCDCTCYNEQEPDLPQSPEVSTRPADSVTAYTAKLNGVLISMGSGENTAVSFKYGTDETNLDLVTDSELKTTTGSFYFEISGLIPDTIYYFQAKALSNNYVHTHYALSFKTLPVVLTVTTIDADNITQNSARLRGTLDSMGSASEVQISFKWGEISGDIRLPSPDAQVGGVISTCSFSTNLTGLEPNTSYYFQAKAVGDDIVYGDTLNFTTLSHDSYELTVSSSTGGSVIIPGEDVFTYDAGEVVTLLAEADADWQFDRWEGPVANQDSAATTVTMDADKTVTALFKLIPPFEITSSAFNDGGAIPSIYSRWGGNVSPPLTWTGVPAGTVSFVLIMEDPVGWGTPCTHWIVFNIPSAVTSLAQGASSHLPEGALQGTGSDEFGYYGCEPLPGEKNSYYFTLYALDTMLSLSQGANKLTVMNAMEGHIIDQTVIYGTYQG